jgi:hypothetical protein
MPEGWLSSLCGPERTALIPARRAVGADQRSGASGAPTLAEQEKSPAAKDDPDQFAAARQEQQAQGQRVALRQKTISDYGIETWPNRRDLVANPFSFRGRIIGLSVSFGQMLSEKEAVFSGGGEFVVTRVPPTMFRGNESVILAAKVIGNKSMKTPTGGEITVPCLEFVGAWPLAEKRAQIIRHLGDALALAAEIKDALPPIRAGGTTGGTVGVGGRSFLERSQ